jgi:antitoxin MazE
MLSKIQKWGNSQGVRIPLKILENSHINIGEEIEMVVEEGKIVITPTHKIHGKYAIKDLVAEMPAEYEAEEVNWGEAKGKEEW